MVDKKRIMYRKKWRAEEEERHKRPIRNFTTGPQW
jgi:hypothetical protein